MNKKLFAKLFAIVLAACVIFSLAVIVTSAADGDPAASFELGANGTASHYDGSSKTSYTETVGDYTLSITGGTNMYTGARDAKGNSCIKFGTSSKPGSMTFTVPDDVTSVDICVAAYKAKTATVTINNVKTTLTCKSDNGQYDVITVDTSETKTVNFAVTSGKRAMLNTINFYAEASTDPDAPVCEHANVSTATTDATCHVDGSVKTVCVECGKTVSSETIPAAHTFANGVCSVCNLVEAPKAGVPYKFGMYQGNKGATYYINGEKDDKGTYYYLATSADVASGVNVYLEETEGGYYLYAYIAGVKTYINMYLNETHVNNKLSETASTVYTYDTTAMQLVANVNDAEYAFGTRNDKTYTTVGPVKVSYNGFHCQFYAAGDVAKFNSASVTLGTDLGMIFKATVPAGVPTLTVEFNGKTYELTGNAVDTVYSFNFKGIGPHQMALNIKATLKVDGVAVAEINNYSVEKNLNSIKNAEGASTALVELVNSVLIYGDESEKYVGNEEGVNADELANNVAENNATYTLDNAETFGFTAAGVNFDAMNRIYVKFFVEGDFTLTVNGAVVAVEKTEDGYYKVYTDALEATQFADEYTFVITAGDETATFTYSVNAYAAAMKGDAEMGALAEALYAYGVKAKAYAG